MDEQDTTLHNLQLAADAAPTDPRPAFLLACAYDGRGFEREAIPYYQRAIENGLAGDDLQMAFINLGSSHRALGEYEQAVAAWSDARTRFPGNRALATFLALGLHNLGDHTAAAEILLTQLAETTADPWITRYRRAILFYADKLDETW